ncbi:spore germination protein [Paenibacillus sp. MMS18-CY102]|uniref:spore germination protein n=1 Tax=Paenibacillus sp. MMS18-CY102 TaxID=2682849 RepID=UPI0013664F18|nr:spore germination protein [Paenibacillus sp. MMS18-CY102]
MKQTLNPTHKKEGPAADRSLSRWIDAVNLCGDVSTRHIPVGKNGGATVYLFYCIGMIDSREFQMSVLDQLEHWEPIDGHTSPPIFIPLEDDTSEEMAFQALASGTLIAIIEDRWYRADINSQPGRQPEESTMEVSLKGPRDGFVEKIETNIALVRKRLRTPDLRFEFRTIGSATGTQVAVLYMANKAETYLIEEMRRRLDEVKIEALYSSTQLEELISDRPMSLFPLVDYMGRPDFVVEALMNGRLAVIVDGSPSAIIAPTSITLLIKSPEDTHLPYHYVSLERLLRAMGLAIALCVPGFWVALSAFNSDQIPFVMLATVTVSRSGLPMSAPMEMMLMLAMFELFREAGVRLPRPVGQTVSVVGGLIVGDAAIRAGLTSPTMLVAAAVTAVATFTLVNQNLNGSVSVIRLFILVLSSILGIFGLFVGLFVVVVYMCSLESFGQPYMLPLAPFRWKQALGALLQLPWSLRRGRRKGQGGSA